MRSVFSGFVLTLATVLAGWCAVQAKAEVPPADPSSAVIQITSIYTPDLAAKGEGTMSATIYNRSSMKCNVKAQVVISGQVRLLDASAQTVEIPAGGTKTVYWKIKNVATTDGVYEATFYADAVNE